MLEAHHRFALVLLRDDGSYVGAVAVNGDCETPSTGRVSTGSAEANCRLSALAIARPFFRSGTINSASHTAARTGSRSRDPDAVP